MDTDNFTNHYRILTVDVEKEITKLLRNALKPDSFTILETAGSADALQKIKDELPDIIIYDASTHVNNRIEFLKQIRRQSEEPVIILDAWQNSNEKVKHLELGADDYITKPFSLAELLARIRVLLRRCGRAEPLPVPPCINLGNIKIDFAARQVTVNEKISKLSRKEYYLLQELVLNAGKVLTYSHILTKIWGLHDLTPVLATPSFRILPLF